MLTPYQRLQLELEKIISTNQPGTKLPSEPDLAKMFGVSRSTLREAMRTFEVQGLIRRRQGQGTFVVGRQKALEGGLEVLESIETLSQRMGLNVSLGEWGMKRLKVDKENQTFSNFPLGSTVLQVDRIITSEERPIAFLIDIAPVTILNENDLEEGFEGSVLDWMLKRGKPLLDHAKTRVDSISASSEIAHKLQIQRAAPLLFFVSDVMDRDGNLVTHSYSYFIPGFFDFHIIRKVVGEKF